MPTVTIDIPEALWARMQRAAHENWQAVALDAFRTRLRGSSGDDHRPSPEPASSPPDIAGQKQASYGAGYAWARDRARRADLKSMVDASYAAAANIVRRTEAFSTRDEFGQAAYPSDEMWESFVDGATAWYRDIEDG